MGNGSVVMWIVGLSPFVLLLAAAVWRGAHTGAATSAPPHGHADLAAGMLVALWNYMGWDNASTIAGEVEEPQRTYPRVMVIAALMTMATYLLPVAAVWFAGIPPDQFSTGAWVDAAQNLVGYPLALALTLVAALDSLGNFNSLTLSYTRLPYALACDSLLPKVLTYKLPNGVPWVSLLLCALGWSLALGLKFDRLITVDISLWGLSVIPRIRGVGQVADRGAGPAEALSCAGGPRPWRSRWGLGPAALVVFALLGGTLGAGGAGPGGSVRLGDRGVRRAVVCLGEVAARTRPVSVMGRRTRRKYFVANAAAGRSMLRACRLSPRPSPPRLRRLISLRQGGGRRPLSSSRSPGQASGRPACGSTSCRSVSAMFSRRGRSGSARFT